MPSLKGSCYLAGRGLAVGLIAVALALPARAQNLLVSKAAIFRADSALVLVPVTVLDRRGAIVNGLAGDAFTVTEDGVPQPIRSFSEDDVPVSIGVVLDLSGSMKGVLPAAKESLRALLKDANPADEAFLNGVSSRPRPYLGFTHDFDEIVNRAAFERADGDTALIDTIWDSLRQLHTGVHARRALLVISDGQDNHSRRSKRELLEAAMEADAQVYTVALASPPAPKPIAQTEARQGLLFLDELAAKTGGLSFAVRNGSDIVKAAANIGHALRNQYTIGYAPRGDGAGGKWRKIGVKVANPELRAYARSGFRLQ